LAETTQSPPPPKEGEIQIDVAKLNGSEAAAGEALSGLFEPEATAEQDTHQGASQDGETGQAEKPATDDTDTGHSEQDESSAIEPPVSWTAEAKENFAKLPPELQQYVVARESDRERFIATQGQKTSEETRLLAEQRKALENDRAQQTQVLQSILLQLTPELQRFQNVDWQKLAAEKPAEWAAMSQARQDVMERINAASAHINNLNQQQQAEAQKRHQDFVTQEQPKLLAKFPDIADPVKAKAFGADLTKYLPEITQQEFGSLADHRYVLIARDAMLYRKAIALKQSAQQNRAPAPQSNVRPLRPAARQGNVGEEAAKKEFEALHGKLARTGSTRDAQSILERIL